VELLTGNDAVVVYQNVEDRSSEVPGSGVDVPQLIFQFNAAGVIHPARAGRRLRWHRYGVVEITRGTGKQATLEGWISPDQQEGVNSCRVTHQLRHRRRRMDQVS
jgi:hypothetical protein